MGLPQPLIDPLRELEDVDQGPDFDAKIESILRIEDHLRQRWLPNAETAREAKSGTFRLPRIIPDILETLQDLRWTLMALRAEVEDPGDAPVFGNPRDLLGYLKTPSM